VTPGQPAPSRRGGYPAAAEQEQYAAPNRYVTPGEQEQYAPPNRYAAPSENRYAAPSEQAQYPPPNRYAVPPEPVDPARRGSQERYSAQGPGHAAASSRPRQSTGTTRSRRYVPPQLPPHEPRRGGHATPYGQGFSWVLVWTMLGTLIPGTGLIAAGWRRLGAFLIIMLGLTGVALAYLTLTGNVRTLALSLAFDPELLFAVAVAAPAIGTVWILVILLTNSQLRRYASLNSGQRIFGGVVVLALITAVALPAYKVSSYAMITRSVVTSSSVFRGDTENGTTSGPSAQKADPWANKAQMNVLLIGSDAGADRTGIRPDTLILASVNTKTGKTVMFSLPRSLQHAPFPPGTGGNRAWPDGYYCPNAKPGAECLINAIWAWAEGDGKQYYSNFKNPGLRATEDAVEGVTGLKVDTYVMLNLNGFKDFVDALGGVTVDVHKRLPIGGNTHHRVATDGYIEKGNNQHLDGYHALWFARSRWSTGDYDRMQRQRCVIGAVVDQSDPLKVARNFPRLAKALKKNLATGIHSSDLGAWATLAQRIQKGGVTSIVFDPSVINTVNPDIPEIHKLVTKAVKATARTKKPSPDLSVAGTPSPSATAGKDSIQTPGKAQTLKSVC
jgi:LCP family protein required for cell wall assembly